MDQQTHGLHLTVYAIGDSDCHIRFSAVQTPKREDIAYDLGTYKQKFEKKSTNCIMFERRFNRFHLIWIYSTTTSPGSQWLAASIIRERCFAIEQKHCVIWEHRMYYHPVNRSKFESKFRRVSIECAPHWRLLLFLFLLSVYVCVNPSCTSQLWNHSNIQISNGWLSFFFSCSRHSAYYTRYVSIKLNVLAVALLSNPHTTCFRSFCSPVIFVDLCGGWNWFVTEANNTRKQKP